MNIRDYLFIRKAKSSNKIKILDVLGFETDTTIIQTPDIIKEMDNLRITSELDMVDVEVESTQIGQELVITNEDLFRTQDQENSNPNTETFVPFKYSSTTFTEFLIRPGVNNNNILAIITIKKPSKSLFLYLIRYLFKYFNSFN